MAVVTCVQVTDEFKQGQWLVSGNVTDVGAMPYGKLCGGKEFTYTATFGPFKNCGKKKVGTTFLDPVSYLSTC